VRCSRSRGTWPGHATYPARYKPKFCSRGCSRECKDRENPSSVVRCPRSLSLPTPFVYAVRVVSIRRPGRLITGGRVVEYVELTRDELIQTCGRGYGPNGNCGNWSHVSATVSDTPRVTVDSFSRGPGRGRIRSRPCSSSSVGFRITNISSFIRFQRVFKTTNRPNS